MKLLSFLEKTMCPFWDRGDLSYVKNYKQRRKRNRRRNKWWWTWGDFNYYTSCILWLLETQYEKLLWSGEVWGIVRVLFGRLWKEAKDRKVNLITLLWQAALGALCERWGYGEWNGSHSRSDLKKRKNEFCYLPNPSLLVGEIWHGCGIHI